MIGYRNIETTEDGIDYQIHAGGRFLAIDRYENYTETAFLANGQLSKAINNNTSFVLVADMEIAKQQVNDTGNNKREAYTFNPGFTYSNESFYVNLFADLFLDKDNFTPFADIEFGINVYNKSVQPYLGVNQEVFSNTMWRHYHQNPFFATDLDIGQNSISQKYFAGVRGKLKSYLLFDISGGYEDVENYGFYFLDRGVFDLVYDDMTNVYVNAEIAINPSSNTEFGGTVNHNFYKTSNIPTATNLPSYRHSVYGELAIWEKVNIRTDIFFTDAVDYLNNTNEVIRGNVQADLGIGIEAKATDNIELWIQGMNLLDQNYIQFENYPQFGINILGGIIVKL